MDKIFKELRRRNVFRVAGVYAVVGWLLAQAAVVLETSLGFPAWFDGVVVGFLLIGFPIAMVLAWAFEMTPEGVRLTASVPEGESIAPKTGRKLDFAIVGGLGLLALMIAWQQLSGPKAYAPQETAAAEATPASAAEIAQSASNENSVAVLPFIALSSGEDDGFFSDGLTEEILNSLAAVPDLLVTARTSSFYFKDKDIPIDEIADRLGVAHVVEGSVRRAGNQLRITAQLIRAKDGFHMWSQTYDRPVDHVFQIQTEIAENIAGALSIYLDDDQRTQIDRSGTRNVEAFQAFLKGQDRHNRAHALDQGVTLWNANEYFERAMALDPKYVAPAIAHHDAFGHLLLDGPHGPYVERKDGTAQLSQEEARRLLFADLDRAIENARTPTMRLAAELNKAFFSSNWSRMPGLVSQFKKEGSIEEATMVETVWLSNIFNLYGEYDLLRRWTSYSLKIDPLDHASWDSAVSLELATGNYDAAEKTLKRAREVAGDHVWLRTNEIYLDVFRNDKAKLIEILRKLEASDRRLSWSTAYLAAIEGDDERAARLAEEVEAKAGWPISQLLLVYYQTGDRKRARALTKRIDDLPAGATIFGRAITLANNRLYFDIEDAPKFAARLKEAQIDPKSFAPFPQVGDRKEAGE